MQHCLKLRGKGTKETKNSLAQRMGTNTKQLWRIENKKADLTGKTLERYIANLGYSLSYSFTKNA